MKRRLILVTLLAIAAWALGVPLVAALVGTARAAALLDMNGQKIVVLTGDEFFKAMKAKDDEIEALKAQLADKRKVECNLL